MRSRPSGVIQAGPERISVRVTGQFTSEESLRDLNLRINDRFFRLSDVATISRGYVDPPQALFRFKGQPAIGLAIGMKTGANLLHFGEALQEQMDKIIGELPIGVGVHLVADQPIVVEEAVGGFTKALFEAVAIVLVVSFLSLGMRAGFVVALSIPLVLAMTFVVMQYTGISLQRISLGALIIALGLLVDDAMIAVEMMVARLEAGDTLRKAATAVYTSTAFPMLTGTLVTVASFIPVGLNSSNAGEFTFTLFVVIAASLLLSWIVAVLFAPLLGVTLLPKTMKKHHDKPSRLMTVFSRVLVGAMRWRWLTIGVTVAMFGVSLYGMKFVEQQFFPSSDRNELLVDFTLPQNASITDTKAQMDRFEAKLAGDPDIDHWSSYVGQSAVRFILAFDPQPSNPNYGQMVIVTKSIEARERLRAKIKTWARQEFAGLDVYTDLLAVGPPAGRPVQYRLSGPDVQKVRDLAQQLAALVGEHPRVTDIGFNWNEPARVVKVDVLQDKARQLGVTSQDIAGALNSVVGGTSITQVRDAIYLVDVVGRARAAERQSIETLQNLQLPGKNGQSVPLAAVATFHYELEQPVIWRRSRLPTITIRGSIVDATQPATIVQQLEPKVQEFVRDAPGRLRGGGGWPRGGERQVPGADHGGGPAHAVHHGNDPDASVAELLAAVPGGGGGSARADRRGGGDAAERCSHGLRGHPGGTGAGRHPDPQLGDPGRADRGPAAGGPGPVGGRGRGHHAPDAADPAYRGGGEPGADPDLARGVLGADGLRHDGRDHRGHGVDPRVSAGAVRGLVPDQGALPVQGGTANHRSGA